MAKNNKINLLKILLYTFVLIAIILALFFDGNGINLLSKWFTKVFISIVYSIVAGALVGAFTGNLLKRKSLNTKILGINFNIPIAVLTFIVKIWLF